MGSRARGGPAAPAGRARRGIGARAEASTGAGRPNGQEGWVPSGPKVTLRRPRMRLCGRTTADFTRPRSAPGAGARPLPSWGPRFESSGRRCLRATLCL
eukprot:8817772-Pyramimonas_sp.AAC.1